MRKLRRRIPTKPPKGGGTTGASISWCCRPKERRASPGPRPLINQTVPHGKSHQLVDAVQIELLHDASAMRIDCVNAQVQHDRDLFVGLALGEHLEDLALARGEEIDGI